MLSAKGTFAVLVGSTLVQWGEVWCCLFRLPSHALTGHAACFDDYEIMYLLRVIRRDPLTALASS